MTINGISKNILLRLKSEPFVDSSGEQVIDNNGEPISVYDKTMFILFSNHGFGGIKMNLNI